MLVSYLKLSRYVLISLLYQEDFSKFWQDHLNLSDSILLVVQQFVPQVKLAINSMVWSRLEELKH